MTHLIQNTRGGCCPVTIKENTMPSRRALALVSMLKSLELRKRLDREIEKAEGLLSVSDFKEPSGIVTDDEIDFILEHCKFRVKPSDYVEFALVGKYVNINMHGTIEKNMFRMVTDKFKEDVIRR